eukprot:TRINITY_DN16703_c0_g1_i1.p1 TRINITY_DN16703_c0_g1~~TRINITY_DN16703_c0_g1_i1.p1  ORF type:complete len:290 (-),score=35.75 TRINITY_DN16703_c0_g1_i1:54-884(-)
MDTAEWSKQRFVEIKTKLSQFLKTAGFRLDRVTFIPCSGLQGTNLVSNDNDKLKEWYVGPTLIAQIDAFQPAKNATDKPFRLAISDVYKSDRMGITVGGKIQSGIVEVGNKLRLVPQNQICTVKSILKHQLLSKWAKAGDSVDLGVSGLDMEMFHSGTVLCDPEHPILSSIRFTAKIIVFDVVRPITKGHQVEIHTQCSNEEATIHRLVAKLDPKTGVVAQKRPLCLLSHTSAMVQIKTARPVCIELYKDARKFGSITIREQGRTIAAGIITEIQS